MPWLNYLLVNAPDEYYGGYSWFDYPGDIVPGIHRSRKLLFELLDDLRAKNFPADQITLGGFSQGCLMSIETGLRYPHRFAGIVGISGWVFEIEKLIRDLTPVAKSQRLLITHGQYDPLLPFAEAQQTGPAVASRRAERGVARISQGTHHPRRGRNRRHPRICARRLCAESQKYE